MSNKRYQEVEKFILLRKTDFIDFLGLEYFDIEFAFLDSFYGDDSADDYKTTAVTEGRWQYRQAKIKFYMPSAVRHSDEELEKILMHELVHVLLLPEQSLVDSKLSIDSSFEPATSEQHSQIEARNYELLELSTENVTRALLGAWRQIHTN